MAAELSQEDVDRIAEAVVEKAMEDVGVRDIMIGCAMGKGAIPLYGRENRKEPCSCCLIDPDEPNAPENRMCTTKGAIGTLNDREERDWCSEIKIVGDGRCARARAIGEAARECKGKHPEDTEAFFRCYIPAFSQTIKGSNPGNPNRAEMAKVLAIIDSRPKGDIVESKLRKEFGDVLIDSLRQSRYVTAGSAGPNPPLLVTLAGREVMRENPTTKYLARLDPALATRPSEEKVFDTPGEAIAYAETLKTKMLPGDVVHVREGIGFEYKVIYRYLMPSPTKGSNPGLTTKPHSIGNPMALTKDVLKLEVRIPLELLWKDEPNYMARLTEDVRERGITDPITIRIREDGSMIVWEGLHRLAVAQKLGIEEIPVIYIGGEG